MADLTIKVKGLNALQQNFNRAPQFAEPIYQKAIVASQFVLEKNNTRDNPTPYKTGNLLASFRFRQGRLRAAYFPTAKYALAVHEGTAPRIIVPRRKKALYWPGALHPVKSVRHPGTKANPYMVKLRRKAQPEIDRLFGQATEMLATKLAKL